ncbi:hypothetical protein N0V90_002318 [Kalmusia sp. IMI 367209]|nr:hypothetical protein N0V90_002318 [Kalmusia sp. IMI 367209]
MRAASILAAAAAFMSSLVSADWYLYEGWVIVAVDGSTDERFQIFAGPPSCDDVFNGLVYTPSDDVSGDKEGIRCDGCSPYGEDINPTVVEINEDFGHYTWYADRGGDMVDLDGNVVGNCVVDTSDTVLLMRYLFGISLQGRLGLTCATFSGFSNANGHVMSASLPLCAESLLPISAPAPETPFSSSPLFLSKLGVGALGS